MHYTIVMSEQTPKPKIENNAKGQYVLNLPFDNGSWVRVILGAELPNFTEWLADANPQKAMTARYYISALEGCLPSRKAHDALREEWDKVIMQEGEAFVKGI
jgi:hypothetical protein